MSRQALLVLIAVSLSNAATWCVRLVRPALAAKTALLRAPHERHEELP